ncbi:MAG: ATP-dependent RecD-like DNA helicase [Acidobacteriota bacterium]
MGETPPGDLFSERLTGTIRRVVFEDPASRWAVVRLDVDGGGRATVVGNLAPLFEGERLEVEGSWVEDSRFGRQFRAGRALSRRPVSRRAIRRYLASGVIPGIGPELADRLVKHFGARVLEIIDQEPDQLLSVPGIGKKRLARIRQCWRQQAAERSSRLFFQELGLGGALIGRILRAWGAESERRVRENPYCLAASDEIPGIGFRRADKLARQLPHWAAADEARARAALLHVLETESAKGHCFVADAPLLGTTADLMELRDEAVVQRALAAMLADGSLVAEPLSTGEADRLHLPIPQDGACPRAIYLEAFYGAESRVAKRLAKTALAPSAEGLPGSLSAQRARRATAWVERQLGVDLGEEQKLALQAVLREKLLLVTGGPGTGKTKLIDAVVRCGEAVGARMALAAPTGRAAKRLAQATHHDSQTLHRLLEYRPRLGGFARNSRHPLDADLVVVDEASMVDLFLMDALLAAVPESASLLFVGDADQLPPVGPGAVLRDLLASGRLPTVRLTEIYRQARRSLIVRNAHRVNAGKLPVGLDRRQEWGAAAQPCDFYFIDEGDSRRARELVLELVARRIPQRFGISARRDIQVLAPMHRGQAGVERLNDSLQETLNPGTDGLPLGEITLRAGDRVMQQRNDYDREVFNGDIGWVVKAAAKQPLVVEFEGREVSYDPQAAHDLALAYAVSVHKSQGNEYPAVVVLLLPEHHMMLQRNLLYTALTRAKQLAVLVGSRSAVARAVRNAEPMRRCTRLARRIAETLGDFSG